MMFHFSIKKFAIILAFFWVILLVIALSLSQKESMKITNTPEEQDVGYVNNPAPDQVKTVDYGEDVALSKITGIWVSDRSPKTLLTLTEDMNYIDKIWLGEGSFTINGPYLLLVEGGNSQKSERVLMYEEINGESILVFTIDRYRTIFKPAQKTDIQEVELFLESEAGKNELPSCEGLFEKAYEVLSSQSWNSDNGSVAFTEQAIVITATDGTSTTYQYEVTGETIGAEGDPYVFTIPVEIKDNAGTVVSSEPMKIITGADGFFVRFQIGDVIYKYTCVPVL